MVAFTSSVVVQVLIKKVGPIAQLLEIQPSASGAGPIHANTKFDVFFLWTDWISLGVFRLERKGKAYPRDSPCGLRWQLAVTFTIVKTQSRRSFATSRCCRGIYVRSVWEMKCSTCLYYCWGLLTLAGFPVSVGEMYTSLLNVKQAISVERRLIDYLRTYVDHELERLNDIKRWVARMVQIFVICMSEIAKSYYY